jgi:DNA-binding PucR family transcriptional regulator
VLLETLRTYVRSGWNAASAAAQLGVHERTVGYRLATIEQRLGRPLSARRQELGAALRLTETLRRPRSPGRRSRYEAMRAPPWPLARR